MEELTLPARVPAFCPFPAACTNSELQLASSGGQWCGPLCLPTLGRATLTAVRVQRSLTGAKVRSGPGIAQEAELSSDSGDIRVL